MTSATSALRAIGRLPAAFLLAVGFLVLTVGLTAFADSVTAYNPITMNPASRLRPPSAFHLFGTDMYGRDIFSRVLHGGQTSLTIGIATAVISTLIGSVIGLVAGSMRVIDTALMRIMDGVMAIPGILLAIALATIFGGGVFTVILAMTVPEVPVVARLVRSSVVSIREQQYIDAAQSYGVGRGRLMLCHILPIAFAPIAVQATYICGVAILAEAYLSFVGVGIPPEQPSWGNIVAEARSFVLVAPYMIIYPSVVIAVVVLAINIAGDAFRDYLDPRININS